MFDAAAGLGDLVGRHGGVADEDHLVVRAVLVQQVKGGGALGGSAQIVLPHGLVDEVVEVEVLQVLELGLARREELFADLHVGVHGAADVQQQEQLDGVAAFRAHLDVEQAGVAGGVVDGAVQVQLFRRAFAGELA
ncbi:hypothetical protein D9M70_569530 [compost metagenome]